MYYTCQILCHVKNLYVSHFIDRILLNRTCSAYILCMSDSNKYTSKTFSLSDILWTGLCGAEHVQLRGEHVPDAVHAADQPAQPNAGARGVLPHEHPLPAPAVLHEARRLLQHLQERLVRENHYII